MIVTLSQKKHKFFKKRHGDNLMADIELNLKEALLGYNKKITHLDKREFYVESKDVTQPFQERVITFSSKACKYCIFSSYDASIPLFCSSI